MVISIREWKMEDAGDITLAINDKAVLDNLRDGIPFPYTKEDAVEFITSTLISDKNSNFAFAITCDDTVVGSIGVFRKDNIHNRTGELGYYVARGYWGKGIATTAIKMICDYVFNQTDIVRIFAEPFSYNAASCRVLEKAGFVFEGTLSKNAFKNGQLIDMKMYALIK